MNNIFRVVFAGLGILLGTGVLLAVVALVLLFSQPQWLLGAVNAIQSTVRINAENLTASLRPLQLNLENVQVNVGDHTPGSTNIHISKGMVGVALGAGLAGQPFWSIRADKVQVNTAAVQPGQGQPAEARAGNADAPSLNNLPRVLFLFQRLQVEQLSIPGTTPITAELLLVREENTIDLNSNVTLDRQGLAVFGEINIAAAASMPFQLQADLTPVTRNQDGDGIRGRAKLAGKVAVAETVRLWLTDSSLQLNGHALDIHQGQLDWSGDTLEVIEWQGKLLPADVTHPAGTAYRAEAAVRKLFTNPGLDLNLWFGTQDAATQVELAAQMRAEEFAGRWTLSSTGLPAWIPIRPFQPAQMYPLEINSRFSFSPNLAVIEDFTLRSPSQRFSLVLNTTLQPPLDLEGELHAEQLLWPIVEEGVPDAKATEPSNKTGEDQPPADPVAEQAPLFSNTPINWGWLDTTRINFNLRAKNLYVQQANFSDVNVDISSGEGTFVVHPLRGRLGSGDEASGFTGELHLSLADTGTIPREGAEAGQGAVLPPNRARTDQPVSLTVDFGLQGVSLEDFGFLPTEELSGGDVYSKVNLSGKGNSALQLVQSLNGEILLMIEHATLANDFVEVVGSDMLMETVNKLNPFYKEDPATELECGLVRFEVKQGVLNSRKQLVVETGKMQIIGDGSITLGDEKIDITLSPSAKEGVGVNVASLVKFIKLGGKIRHPVPVVDALGVLQSGAAIGAALSTGGVSVLAEGLAKRVINATSACRKIREPGNVSTHLPNAGDESAGDKSVVDESVEEDHAQEKGNEAVVDLQSLEKLE